MDLPDIHSLDQARDHLEKRATQWVHTGPIARIMERDAQALGWMLADVFARHPAIGQFTLTDRGEEDDTVSDRLRVLKISAKGLPNEPRPNRARLAAFEADALAWIRSYGTVNPDTFYDLLDQGPCRRDAVHYWVEPLAGESWAAMCRSHTLFRDLEAALPPQAPARRGPRL